jgi:hypothetical protein
MNDTKITAEQFLDLFSKATAVDYAGEYMTIQDDEEEFIFLPNWDGGSEITFPKDIIKNGVFVNAYNDMFRFDSEDAEWFGLLQTLSFRG